MNLKSLLSRYTVDQLKEAIRLRRHHGKVEALQQRRDALLKQVAKIDRNLFRLNGNGSAPTAKSSMKSGRRRWKLSAETRRKMSEAAKRRYTGKRKADAPSSGKWKRKPLSAETKAKMAAAARARWAKVKGATEGV